MIDEFAKEYLHGDLREIREAMLRMLEGLSECRPPVAWDHFDACSASVMGPPVRQ